MRQVGQGGNIIANITKPIYLFKQRIQYRNIKQTKAQYTSKKMGNTN